MDASSRGKARGDLLRVALIGTGFGSRVQLPGFMSLADTAVVALCGKSEEKTRAIAHEYGVRAVYTDYEQMLVDVRPDLVSVTTPPNLHNPMVMAALQVGAHVLCEKPMALNSLEAHEMLAEADARGLVHVIDHEFRYLPARYYQRVLVDQGYVGEPLLLEATVLSSRRLDPSLPWNWWSDRAQGGGILFALGSHMIDTFRWLSGREVVAVTAVLSTTPALSRRKLADGVPMGVAEREVTSDDTAVVALEFTGGLRGVITLSNTAAGEMQRLAVHGTEGALVVQDDQHLFGRRLDEPLKPILVPTEYEPVPWVPDENLLLGPFAKLAGLMVDAIRGRSLVALPTFRDGLAVQRVLDAALISSAEGRRVVI